MPNNQFKPFAVGSGANVLSQTEYEALTGILANGFSSGTAVSAQLNKVWRQSSIMAAVLAQFIVDESGQDAQDDGTTATLLANLKAGINIMVSAGTSPAGSISFFARNSAPTGYLKANGAAISRTTYATLFTAIGTTFGVGDGSTTFNIPDLRGEFIRGWDDSRGVDTGRSLGTNQLDALQNLTGQLSFQDDGLPAGVLTANGVFGRGPVASNTIINGSSATYTTAIYATFDASLVARTAAETRSRNVALLACVKY